MSVAVVLALTCVQHSRAADRLGTYDSLALADVTVSGVSSGAFFAHQFEIAHSGLVSGAGLVAGGPYGCAKQIPSFLIQLGPSPIQVGMAACTRAGMLAWLSYLLADTPNAEASVDWTRRERERGNIDDPENLSTHRVWIFSGGRDDVVPTSTAVVLKTYYELLGLPAENLKFEERPDAGLGLPVEEFACESSYPKRHCYERAMPFIIDCDRDAAELLFRHSSPASFAGGRFRSVSASSLPAKRVPR
jgi:pimeloyl-ACP methyl ester carboxylesterase